MASAIPQERAGRDRARRACAHRRPGGRRGAPRRWPASSSQRTGRSRSRPRSGSRRSRSGSRRRSRRSCLDLDESGAQALALAHRRLPAGVRGAAARGVPRALVVLERGLLGRRRRVRRGDRPVLLRRDARADSRAAGARRTRASRSLPTPPRGTCKRARRVTGRPSRRSIPVDAASRPAGSGRRSAICSSLRVISSAGRAALRSPARVAAGAAGRGARRPLLPRLLAAGARRRPDRLRPRGIRRRLPVAPPPRPGGGDGARRAHEQLAR